MIKFLLNDKTIATDLPPGTVLLDFIRYRQQLPGTKIGCREGDCGACTILVGQLVNGALSYRSMTSCLMPLGNAVGKHIVSIEGINFHGILNPIQQAMADAGATQCGFCTPGFVVSLAGFCLQHGKASYDDAIEAIDGNICRCTGYKSIERAAAKITELLKEKKDNEPAVFAAENKILPGYFAGIKEKLLGISLPTNGTAVMHATVLGGGTDLYVQKHEEMIHADIDFVFDIPELKGIDREANKIVIGPSTTVTDLKASSLINEVFPEFQRYAKLVSSTPIRNMATLAGNFINASPIGDFTIFFLALDAKLLLTDGENTRVLPLRKLYTGYKQLDKKAGESIIQISFDLPASKRLFHFEKVSKRTHLDIASVNSAISIETDDDTIQNAGISAGGVGPVPLFLEKTSEFMAGRKINEELVADVIAIMETEISPISDARGTKEYKTFLLGQLIKAHFLELFPQLISEKIVG